MQLNVMKADGSTEKYLHTKVIGAINNALDCIGQSDIYVAEQLAEVVTYYLYHKQDEHNITSGKVFSVLQAVLTAAGHEDAAVALTEHHFERRLKRNRIEVVSVNLAEPIDAQQFCRAHELADRQQWDKSKIVEKLINSYNVDRRTARAIATMVEDKILNMGITLVPTGLIKQLVLSDMAAILRAQQQLQPV